MSHQEFCSKRGTGIILMVLLCGSITTVLATNMYETHGYDYEFDEDVLFPVAWDLGRTWFQYRDFANAYDLPVTSPEDFANARTSSILEDALDAGMNTVIIRYEGWMDALNLDSLERGETRYLAARAEMIRELGLNVMLGGFKDILDEQTLNATLQDIIEDYIDEMTESENWGLVIGIHGFDEVDGKYDNSDGTGQLAIRSALDDYHDWSNEDLDPQLAYPFGCFMAKPAMYVPTLLDPNIGGDLNNTIELLCDRQDFPMLDWYPCRTWGSNFSVLYDVLSAEIWGATDLWPTISSSNYYKAYCTKDELWTIDRDESVRPHVTTFYVYETTGEGQMGELGLDEVWSEEVDVDWPFETASSDYRASDIGDRSSGDHDLNGAVVMYHQGDDVDEAQVVFHDGEDLILDYMPDTYETEETHFFCVGEEDYRQSAQYADLDGIIGTAGLRILWCGEGTTRSTPVTRIRIFEKDEDEIVQTGSLELEYSPATFEPVGAVWGYFWDTDSWPSRSSGFVLYDEDGQYVVVHHDGTSGHWVAEGKQVSPISPFTGLFDDKVDPSVLFAYRQTSWPAEHFTPARDLLMSVVSEYGEDGFYLQWRTESGTGWGLSSSPEEIFFDDTVESSDIDCVSFRRLWDRNQTRFFFGGSGIYVRYNHDPFDSGWEDEQGFTVNINDIVPGATRWGLVLSPVRVRHTRLPWVTAMLCDRTEDQGDYAEVSFRASEIIDDNEATQDTSLASIDLYFLNLCSEGADIQSGYAISTDKGAIDLEFEYGIAGTENGGDCLFANVQAFGRYQQENATFLPSHETGGFDSDTLLYMTVAPIVHGCRGISYYGLGMALLCGTPGQGDVPDRLLNWGPSRDGASNGGEDMVDRVNDVVMRLTGEYGGPDFLDALVDHDDWDVLDDEEAAHAEWETWPEGHWDSVEVDELNFIALMNNSTEDILLMVSNDYPDYPLNYASPYIWFQGIEAAYYDDPECYGGYDDWSRATDVQTHQESSTVSMRLNPAQHVSLPHRSSSTASLVDEGEGDIVLDFSYMPPYTVSLLFIPRSRGGNSLARIEEAQVLKASRSSNGDIGLRVSGYHGTCELVVYDMTGRIVWELYDGEMSGGEIGFTIGSGELNKGVYFITMMQDGAMATVQKVLVY